MSMEWLGETRADMGGVLRNSDGAVFVTFSKHVG